MNTKGIYDWTIYDLQLDDLDGCVSASSFYKNEI